MKIEGRYGGNRGGRNPRITFNPSFPPGLTEADYLRQLMRVYPHKVVSMGAGGSRSSGASETEGGSPAPPIFAIEQMSVPDGGTDTFDFGAITSIGYVTGWYTLKRTIAAAPAFEYGIFTIGHDGTNAEVSNQGMVVLPAGTFIGVLFSASIAAGMLRITATDDQASGNATTVELVYMPRPPL